MQAIDNHSARPDPLASRMLAAGYIAREAGQLAMRVAQSGEGLAVEMKGLQDVVTKADRDAEAMIIAKLSSAFPGDRFVGEESGGVDSDQLWIIDPIDGTANFARGMPYWCVVVAYAVDGILEIGVTYDPVSDEVFVARRGQGAWLNGKPISVAQRGGVKESVIGTTFLHSQSESAEYTGIVGRILDAGGDHRRMGSTALMLAHVADGRLDACVVPSCNTWDVASGLLLVREAGGVVNDFIAENGVIGRGPVGAGSVALGPFIEQLVNVKVS